MIEVVFYNKNARNTIATMTSILWFTSIYYISQQDQHNAMYNLWPKRFPSNAHYKLHAAVLLFAQLYCMAKLKFSNFVSLHTYFCFTLIKEFSCAVFVA